MTGSEKEEVYSAVPVVLYISQAVYCLQCFYFSINCKHESLTGGQLLYKDGTLIILSEVM